MEHTSGTIHAVLNALGFRLAHESGGYRVYELQVQGGQPEYIVIRVDDVVPEELLVAALENAGAARDAIIAALQDCGF